MTARLFPQTVIAMMWDFDRTLIPEYMQTPLFAHYGVDGDKFWAEVGSLPGWHRAHGANLVSEDTIYLNHILTYVREGLSSPDSTMLACGS
jgi:hypothetical protein